ncbi:Uu.00g053770.m01.CDS01 [Anthostomella pinea]|uniref:Uu.00g053770.m01.CDS01 n=1 Tax=Anthostomella pinea TaxID=933095 RepID=A0AAI8YM62_9PEZI|nr:Uu.00g053770.m01.CDS01 [Anthostomella pinea]
MNSNIKRVVAFWFNRPPMDWIVAPTGLDAELRSEFGELVLSARRNDLDDWASQPEGSLALVVLLDQFSRNIFRGSPAAFSADAKASDTATRAIARGFDKQVSVIHATAFYMPLMQQESLISVIAARGLFEGLRGRCESKEEREWVEMGVSAMGRHLEQLERFGRFPTRNAVLGRVNTADEDEFLAQHKPSLS